MEDGRTWGSNAGIDGRISTMNEIGFDDLGTKKGCVLLSKINAEFVELVLISKCHAKAKRYPTIKKWFLEKYPEIVQFGMPTEEIKVAEVPATIQEVAELSKAS